MYLNREYTIYLIVFMKKILKKLVALMCQFRRTTQRHFQLRKKIFLGQRQVIVVSELPQHGPRRFVTTSLNEQRI